MKYAYHKQTGRNLSIIIITGQGSAEAIALTRREHFNSIYLKTKNKKRALQHALLALDTDPKKAAVVFDDYIDLPMVDEAGSAFYVPRKANPALASFIIDNQYADYVTACTSGEHSVREVCEFILTLLGWYYDALLDRIQLKQQYLDFLELKKLERPQLFEENLDTYIRSSYSLKQD